ncbi:atrial natriuretic peptide receptor 3-like [Pollicipes pollicipes]|uniref:atrial natriuretic peptide receptor 3-like n=1 Tax=Pollicipes pollicipes TaxID=41117 RepID=UPI0018849DD2|nr:atrial natriuretic peptide receptor 3-like [Pollicipes pollicipes]
MAKIKAGRFGWRKVMLMYETDAYDTVSGDQSCFLAMSSLVNFFKAKNVTYGYFNLEKNRHISLRNNLRSEIGLDYADLFLGPMCDYVIAAVARYAAIWGVPVVTPSAQANAFLDKQGQFRTLTRIMGSYHQLGAVFQPVMQLFDWRVAGLLYEEFDTTEHKGHHSCNFMMKAVYEGMKVKPTYRKFLSSSPRLDFASLLREMAKSARIIILCASPHRVREILLVADDLNMVSSGEYVFFNVELSTR